MTSVDIRLCKCCKQRQISLHSSATICYICHDFGGLIRDFIGVTAGSDWSGDEAERIKKVINTIVELEVANYEPC